MLSQVTEMKLSGSRTVISDCNPMDCSLPGASVHGFLQAILEWLAISFSRVFPTQGMNPGLPHCRQILYYLSHQAIQTTGH